MASTALPRFVTEGGGDLHSDYGSYHPRRQLRWSSTRLLQQERWGFTKERHYYYYDVSHGFWQQPSWLSAKQPGHVEPSDLQPAAVAIRTLSGVLRGTTFHSQLDLGAADDLARAYVFAGTARTVVALFTAGSNTLSMTLEAPGASSAIDVFGNPVSFSRAGNSVTLDVSDLPTYVVAPPGPLSGSVTWAEVCWTPDQISPASLRPLRTAPPLRWPRSRAASSTAPTCTTTTSAVRVRPVYDFDPDLSGPARAGVAPAS